MIVAVDCRNRLVFCGPKYFEAHKSFYFTFIFILKYNVILFYFIFMLIRDTTFFFFFSLRVL